MGTTAGGGASTASRRYPWSVTCLRGDHSGEENGGPSQPSGAKREKADCPREHPVGRRGLRPVDVGAGAGAGEEAGEAACEGREAQGREAHGREGRRRQGRGRQAQAALVGRHLGRPGAPRHRPGRHLRPHRRHRRRPDGQRSAGTSPWPRAASGRPTTPAPPGRPIFDGEGSYSIGCVTLDPKNPNVVWVGTGENNSQRSVGYGDGVYKSTDGGKTLEERRPQELRAHRQDPRSTRATRTSSTSRRRARSGRRAATAASTRRPTAARPGRRSSTISENTGVTDVVHRPAQPRRRCSPPPTSAAGTSGR